VYRERREVIGRSVPPQRGDLERLSLSNAAGPISLVRPTPTPGTDSAQWQVPAARMLGISAD
jgi:hypothetical protein